jgi:hypothetical protein
MYPVSRPLGHARTSETPRPLSPKGTDHGYEEDHLATEGHHLHKRRCERIQRQDGRPVLAPISGSRTGRQHEYRLPARCVRAYCRSARPGGRHGVQRGTRSLGLIVAAAITGVLQRWRNENSAAHGEAIAKLDDIATTVHEIDEQLDDMAEWQEKHQEFHDREARTPR